MGQLWVRLWTYRWLLCMTQISGSRIQIARDDLEMLSPKLVWTANCLSIETYIPAYSTAPNVYLSS